MFKPMLACSTIPEIKDIKYPVYASPKMDGIRCLIVDGVPVSRSLKPIPNLFVQGALKALSLPNLDGELMLRGGDFNDVQSAIMSVEGVPDFVYIVFDTYDNPGVPYGARLAQGHKPFTRVEYVEDTYVTCPAQMKEVYDKYIADGYEGAIVRSPTGKYKFGRSTLKEGLMLKLKPFHDAEGIITGYTELLHNRNESTTNNLGASVRSSHNVNKVSADTLGALVVKYGEETFKIGTGFESYERDRLWHMRDKLVGLKVTFKYQELTKYGKPRFPVYKGLRYE